MTGRLGEKDWRRSWRYEEIGADWIRRLGTRRRSLPNGDRMGG